MKALELKKQELLQSLDRLMKSRSEYDGRLTAGDFIEEGDGAQREISAHSQFSLIERKNKELQKIDYLLNRAAEEQDFGLCEECGMRIPKERLLLVPEATLCVVCQKGNSKKWTPEFPWVPNQPSSSPHAERCHGKTLNRLKRTMTF